MAHELAPLPDPNNALEPNIDARTMEIHHDKHHQAYVTNLNKALESAPDLAAKSAEDLIKDLASVPEAIRGPVRNNGGGHVNHSFFWKLLSAPKADNKPTGKLEIGSTANQETRSWVRRSLGLKASLSSASMSGSTLTT